MRATTASSSSRIIGVDAARGVALVGMICVHLMSLTALEPTGTTTPTWVGWIFAGTASALFATVAGVSLSLMAGRGAHLGSVRAKVVVRALLLVMLGLACGHLDTTIAIILCHYGLLFLCAVPFLSVSTRTLGITAIGWVVISPVVAGLFARFMQSQVGTQSYVDGWRLWHTPNIVDLLSQPGVLFWDLVFTGYYPVLQWTGYILLGLFLGRLNLRRLSTSITLSLAGSGAAVVAWLISRGLLTGTALRDQLAADMGADPTAFDAGLVTGHGITDEYAMGTPGWFASVTPHSGAPLDLIYTAGIATAVIGLCLFLTQIIGGVLRWPLLPVSGAGAIPLTLYIGHLIALHLFSDATADWSGQRVALVYVLIALVLGTVFALWRRRGPLEWMVHEISSGFRPSQSRS